MENLKLQMEEMEEVVAPYSSAYDFANGLAVGIAIGGAILLFT